MFKYLCVVLVFTLLTFCSCNNSNPLNEHIKNLTTPSPFSVIIETSENAIQGQSQEVAVTTQNSTSTMTSFRLKISYDPTRLVFQYAEEGEILANCGWEYFTYKYSSLVDDSIPYGIINITAYANVDNGPFQSYPSCYSVNSSESEQLALLHFLVSNDRNVSCSFAPIQFYWEDCDDNVFKDSTTHKFYSNNLVPCSPKDEYKFENNIDFVNGGIDIVCVDSIDTRCRAGDLTNNGISNEIADAALYSNYFVYGMQVFTADIDCQLLASDVNGDGEQLTVADFVYLIRIIVGDAGPYPQETVNVEGTYTHNESGDIIIEDGLQIAAAQIIVEGEVIPTLLAPNMTMIYNFNSTNTYILIFSLENNSFTGNMVNIGNANIISIEMADESGNPVVPITIPTIYSLGRNYPNPFNPTTTIEIAIPIASEVTFEVRNFNNQIVYTNTQTYEVGIHKIEFDGSNLSSGTYSYTMQSNGFEDKKIMNLLK